VRAIDHDDVAAVFPRRVVRHERRDVGREGADEPALDDAEEDEREGGVRARASEPPVIG
jgi:hypothetical protein